MAQTAAHLADHVIPPVPVRQWVISVPKRLRGFLADRPAAVAALTRIFIADIERLLCSAAGVTRNANAPASAIRYVLPRPKAANWVGPGRSRKSTRPGANGVVELTPYEFLDRLADLVPPPRKHRHRPAGGWRWRSSQTSALAPTARGGRGHGWPCCREASQGCSPRIIGCGKPSRHSRSGMSASNATPVPAGMRATVTPRGAAAILRRSPGRTTPPGSPGRN